MSVDNECAWRWGIAQGAAMQQISDARTATQSNQGWNPRYVQPGRGILGDENAPTSGIISTQTSGAIGNNPAQWRGINSQMTNPSELYNRNMFCGPNAQQYPGWSLSKVSEKGIWHNPMQMRSHMWGNAESSIPMPSGVIRQTGSSAASSAASSSSSWGKNGGVIKRLKQPASVKNAKRREKEQQSEGNRAGSAEYQEAQMI